MQIEGKAQVSGTDALQRWQLYSVLYFSLCLPTVVWRDYIIVLYYLIW